jgi:hypothetical protein
MSQNQENDLQDKLLEIEKYILDPNRNPDVVAEQIRQDKLSKRRKAYREKKLKEAKLKSNSDDFKKKTTPKAKKKITPNSDSKLKTKNKSSKKTKKDKKKD